MSVGGQKASEIGSSRAYGTVVAILSSIVKGVQYQMGRMVFFNLVFWFFYEVAFTQMELFLNFSLKFTTVSTNTLFARGNKNKLMKSTTLFH